MICSHALSPLNIVEERRWLARNSNISNSVSVSWSLGASICLGAANGWISWQTRFTRTTRLPVRKKMQWQILKGLIMFNWLSKCKPLPFWDGLCEGWVVQAVKQAKESGKGGPESSFKSQHLNLKSIQDLEVKVRIGENGKSERFERPCFRASLSCIVSSARDLVHKQSDKLTNLSHISFGFKVSHRHIHVKWEVMTGQICLRWKARYEIMPPFCCGR